MSDTHAAEPATSRNITIAGEQFEVSTPYVEGHVCTAAEAKTLNQTRCENVRNNTAKKVKELIEAGDMKSATAHVTEYDGQYQFTLLTASSKRTLDPVERRAIRLAKELVRNKLAEKGIKVKEYPTDKYEDAVAKVSENEKIIAEAKKQVKAEQAAAEAALADVEID